MTPSEFADHPTSTDWETIGVPGTAGVTCRAWYRPEALTNGVAVAIPLQLTASPTSMLPFSLFQLVQAVGLTWEELVSVSLYGGPWRAASTWQQLAAQPLPLPLSGSTSQILLTADTVPSAPTPAAATGGGSATGLFNRLETDWKACRGLERQLAGMRQQLSSVLGRLNAFDRDLRPDESLAADRLDKDEWHDARRWIRDVAAKVHRCIKAHDIGMTSAAGRRNVIQHTYEQGLTSREAVGDLSSCLHEVQTYRKELANLFTSMGSALQAANTNGVQRAQRILAKISARVRDKRATNRGRS